MLATTGEASAGWFESTVVEVKDDDLVVLQWRDFETPLFLRRRNQLALRNYPRGALSDQACSGADSAEHGTEGGRPVG